MLSCFEATLLLSQRQDRPLKLNEKAQLTLHLSMCSKCRNFSQQMRLLSGLAKQYRNQDNPSQEDEQQ